MKTRSIVALAAMAGLAASASAQVIQGGATATMSLSWIEDPSGPTNGNGVLDAGEKALIIMNISFTGQNNVINFSPAIGPFTSGTILGLGSAYFDIRSTSGDATGLYNGGITSPASTSVGPNNTGGTAGYGVRNPWRLGGNVANGSPATNGFQNVGPGQLPTDPSVAFTTNPITGMERLGWTPNSYAQRTQTFTVSGAVGTNNNVIGLYLDLDGGTTGAAAYLTNANITFGSVNIPIAPAPASLALLGLGGLVAGRRRR